MRGGRALAAALVMLGASAVAPAAQAVTVKPACTGIQTDLDTMGPGDIIELPAGPCHVNLTTNSDTAAFTLQGDPSGSTLEPSNPSTPIISGSAAIHMTITGVTFTGTTGAQAILLENPGEAVTITHDTFTQNAAPTGFGAAISVQTQGNQGTLTSQPTVITQNTFDHNTASSGGAVAVLGANPVTLTGNVFTANGAGLEGGAVILSGVVQANTSPVVLALNQFGGTTAAQGNTSQDIGGAVALAPGKGQPISLTGNTFQNNAVAGTAADDREGGAVYLDGSANPGAAVTQSHNTFTSNLIDAVQSAPTPAHLAAGGAEFVLAGAVASSADRFTGNRVAAHDGIEPWGGAVGALADVGPPALAGVFVGTNDLFTGNSTAVGGWGGAIYVGGPPPACTANCPASSLTLNDSTVVGNTVDAGAGSEGGAIWGSPQDHLAIRNSIVFGNSPKAEVFGFGAGSPSIQYSDVCAATGGPPAPTSTHDICGNPLLDSAGRETATSPTLDAGSNALVPAGTTTDLAGNQRIRLNRGACFATPSATVDMGALESTAPPLALPCPAPISVVEIGSGPLRITHGKHSVSTTSVKLTCEGIGTFCQGTVTLVTVRRFRATDARKRPHRPRALTLGTAKFKLGRGHRTTATIRLSASVLRRFGTAKTAPVSVNVRNHTSKGALAITSTRTVTLALKTPRRSRR